MARFCTGGSGGGQTKEDLLGAGEGEPQKLVRNYRYQINKMLLKQIKKWIDIINKFLIY
jgi:hypothetical protein